MAPVSDGSNPNSPVTLLAMSSHDSEVGRLVERKEKVAQYVELKFRVLKMCLVGTERETMSEILNRRKGHILASLMSEFL